MKSISVFLVIFFLIQATHAQESRVKERYRSDGFYVAIGGTVGPDFEEFFDYLNYRYQPPEKVDDFGGNVSFSLGYLSRFHRNFAFDFGFSIYGLKRAAEVLDPNSAIPEARVRHELEYQSAIFSGTVPILLEFSSIQPLVPYVGVGISIFSARLDDYRDVILPGQGTFGDASRDTRTSVGGHFEAGLAVKLNRRVWIDLRGRWHGGQGHLATLEDNFRDFKVEQSISQYTVGMDYFFR